MVDETKETKKITPKEAEVSSVPDKGQDLKESPETAPTVPASENTTEAEDKLAKALEGVEPLNSNEPEKNIEKPSTPDLPEAPAGADVKVEPIEPPKEGLAPKVPEPNYSDGSVNPDNVAGIGIPGTEKPGMDLGKLKEQVKTPPVEQVKDGMKGRRGIPEISSRAAELHGNESENLDKAA